MSNSTTSDEPIPLTAEDARLTDLMGLVLVDYGIGQVCEAIFWAVYLVLFVYAVRIQIRRGLRSLPAMFMFFVTCLLFTSSTALWVMSFTSYFCRIKTYLRDSADVALIDRIYEGNDVCTAPYGLPMEALFLINMIVGDAVVIWRAWALWQGARFQRLVFLPMVMLLASTIFAIIAMQCLAADSFSTRSSIPNGSRTCQWGEPIAWAISLLTNVTSTSLIAVKAWEHRRFLKTTHHTGTRSERILVVLVESGFVYCLFWLSQVILFMDIELDSNANILYMVLAAMGDQISGVYPTAVIILVSMQRSMALSNSKLFSASDSGRTRGGGQDLPTIQFVNGAAKTQTFPGGSEMSTIDMRAGSTFGVISESSREDSQDLERGRREDV